MCVTLEKRFRCTSSDTSLDDSNNFRPVCVFWEGGGGIRRGEGDAGEGEGGVGLHPVRRDGPLHCVACGGVRGRGPATRRKLD